MRGAAASLLALLLAACHTPQAPVGSVAPVAAASPTQPAPSATTEHYRIDAAATQVLLYVKREGKIAALGHNHVIAIRQLQGVVDFAADPGQSHFELRFPVAELSIDEPALRAAAGADYQSEVNDAARLGTRNNMLGDKLLQAALFPEIAVSSGAIVVSTPDQMLLMELKLQVRGRTGALQVPVHWQRVGNTLRAESNFTLQQSALGLTPFSVAMGALRVADAIGVHCEIVARRI